VVIEERLDGQERACGDYGRADDRHVQPAQDHKAAFDGDRPNTAAWARMPGPRWSMTRRCTGSKRSPGADGPRDESGRGGRFAVVL